MTLKKPNLIFSAFKSALIQFAIWIALTSVPFAAYSQDLLRVGFLQKDFPASFSIDQKSRQKAASQIILPLVYSSLWVLGPGPEYSALPGLAHKWETEDRKTWQFSLIPGATFSDGSIADADDVVFSLKFQANLGEAWKERNIEVLSVEKLDQNTVEVVLKEGYSGSYPPFYRIPILPQHVWQNVRGTTRFTNEHAIGSGPYKVESFVKDESIHLIKREPQTGISAKYEQLVFKAFANSNLLHEALKAGEIDIFGHDGILPATLSSFEETEGISAVVTEGIELHWLSFNLAKGNAINDIRIRKAIMTAINRKKIIAAVYRGYAKPIDSIIYSELADYYPSPGKYDFDIEKAKRILDHAGYTDSNFDGTRDDRTSNQDLAFSLMLLNTNKHHVEMGKLIKEQLEAIGIQINLMKVTPFVYFSFLKNPLGGGYDIALNSGSPGPVLVADIWKMMKSDEDLKNEYNSSHYINYAFDQLLRKMRTTADYSRRSKYLQLMQKIMHDDLPYGVLLRPYVINPVRNKDFHGFSKAMGGISSEINVWSYVEQNEVEVEKEGTGLFNFLN